MIQMNLKFTFHYVSTYTDVAHNADDEEYNLHSTMFLLIRISNASHAMSSENLHSTMFLLIPASERATLTEINDLHSTMFLLILVLGGHFPS